MAHWDGTHLTLRIAFDGPAQSGKTTNLRWLARTLPAHYGAVLETPEERAGRTLYFDRLIVTGGSLEGIPLRYELLALPGQLVFAARRRFLLEKADAVILVCGAGTGMAGVATQLAAEHRAREIPLVVQANQQDREESWLATELAGALSLSPDVPVVPAIAAEGEGVWEAIRLASRLARERAAGRIAELTADATPFPSAEALLEEIRAAEAAHPRSALERILGAVVERPAAQEGWHPPLPDPARSPRWPQDEAAARFLAEACSAPRILRSDLAGRRAGAEGSGSSELYVLQAGAFCLKTRRRSRYENAEAARAEMELRARRKEGLGALAPSRTVLALAEGEDGVWLWTVSPWLKTLRTWMSEAEKAGDEGELARALGAFADAAVAAVALGCEGFSLDIHPSNFALEGDRLVYIDDDINAGGQLPALGFSLLLPVDDWARFPAAVESYVSRLEEEARRTGWRLREELALPDLLRACHPRTPAGRKAQERLCAALSSRPRGVG